MSSIGEKSTIMEKRSFFLRTGSFEKIKCSAKYPFRLAGGIKLSKAAIIELVDDIIVKARILSQKAFLIIFIAIFKLVSVFLSFMVDVSAKKHNVCDNKIETYSTSGYYQRLQDKLQKLQKHKSRLDSLKKDDSFVSSATIQYHSTPKIQKIINNEILDNKLKINNELNINNTTTSTKLTEFHDEITKLRCLSELSLSAASSTSSLSSTSSSLSISSFRGKNLQRICLFPIVYGSIVFMYLQLLFLAIALNTTSIPPGLIFLIASLIFVAFITFKVFFIEKFRKINIKAISRQEIKLQQSIELRKTVEALEHFENNKRQSRYRLKNVIDLNSKTLSKIKLL